MTHTKKIQAEERVQLYSTAQAIHYIKKVRGIDVSYDTLIHQIVRHGVPFVEKAAGRVRRLYFTREVLDTLHFRCETKSGDQDNNPVCITSTDDIKKLEEKYGPLLNTAGMIAAMREKTGRTYTAAALRQRRRRGTIVAIAFTESSQQKAAKRQHVQWWYPASQLDRMEFHPRVRGS